MNTPTHEQVTRFVRAGELEWLLEAALKPATKIQSPALAPGGPSPPLAFCVKKKNKKNKLQDSHSCLYIQLAGGRDKSLIRALKESRVSFKSERHSSIFSISP